MAGSQSLRGWRAVGRFGASAEWKLILMQFYAHVFDLLRAVRAHFREL